MEALTVMRRLAATKSRLDKEQIILDAFMHECHEFFVGARLALDPLVTFGIAKVAEVLEDDGDPGDYRFADFLDLTQKLRKRELTGNAARAAVHDAADRCHVPTWNLFYRRILLKDLDVGVTDKTINKVLKKLVAGYPEAQQYLIPMFACQLAENGDNPKNEKKLKGRKLVDLKLDGVRTICVLDKDADTVTLFTRDGLVIENFPEVQEGLRKLLPILPGSVVLDSEMVHPKGFQQLMTLFQSKSYLPDMAEVNLALFDLVPLHEFREGYCAKPQHERHRMLELLHENGLQSRTNGRAKVLPQIDVDLDTDEGRDSLDEFNRRAIADGYEGIMVKDPDAPYQGKRTVAWLKKKPVIVVTLEIVGFKPGDPDGKYRDTLGALECNGEDEGRQIVSDVTGISDDLRNEIWQNRDRFRGMLVDVIADKLTLRQGSSVYSLRFPRVKGFRGRVPGEKI